MNIPELPIEIIQLIIQKKDDIEKYELLKQLTEHKAEFNNVLERINYLKFYSIEQFEPAYDYDDEPQYNDASNSDDTIDYEFYEYLIEKGYATRHNNFYKFLIDKKILKKKSS